jgi:hypothetical protein
LREDAVPEIEDRQITRIGGGNKKIMGRVRKTQTRKLKNVTEGEAFGRFEDFAAIGKIVEIESKMGPEIGNNFIRIRATGNRENARDGIDHVAGELKGQRKE